jgi:hypothetical protein
MGMLCCRKTGKGDVDADGSGSNALMGLIATCTCLGSQLCQDGDGAFPTPHIPPCPAGSFSLSSVHDHWSPDTGTCNTRHTSQMTHSLRHLNGAYHQAQDIKIRQFKINNTLPTPTPGTTTPPTPLLAPPCHSPKEFHHRHAFEPTHRGIPIAPSFHPNPQFYTLDSISIIKQVNSRFASPIQAPGGSHAPVNGTGAPQVPSEERDMCKVTAQHAIPNEGQPVSGADGPQHPPRSAEKRKSPGPAS